MLQLRSTGLCLVVQHHACSLSCMNMAKVQGGRLGPMTRPLLCEAGGILLPSAAEQQMHKAAAVVTMLMCIHAPIASMHLAHERVQYSMFAAATRTLCGLLHPLMGA